MKRIVVAIDSLKGCLDSLSASKALAEGMMANAGGLDKNGNGMIKAIYVPVADGGEGTAEALSFGDSRFDRQQSIVSGPTGKEIVAEWYYDAESATAFIDMSAAAGLALIDEGQRNPLNTTSYGVGQLLMEAASKGARKILLGLGGSATVDAGLGACQVLGIRLIGTHCPGDVQLPTDTDEYPLPSPFTGKMLPLIKDFKLTGDFRIKQPFAEKYDLELLLLCDVTAPFTGERGAAQVFGPQKGANPEEVAYLENGMENIRELIISQLGIDLNTVAGSGAAGGMAGGLMALAGGKIRKGAPLLLDAIGFDDIIEGADLIITGEGSSDFQTLMGKLPFEILQRGQRKNIPVWLVAGRIADREALQKAGFAKVICINSPEIIKRSHTEGLPAMDPEVARRRLAHAQFTWS